MPVILDDDHPARKALEDQGLPVIPRSVAERQDVRPPTILFINTMPLKEQSEIDFCRLLGNSPLQVDVKWGIYRGQPNKNSDPIHLRRRYRYVDELLQKRPDAVLRNGANIETFPFEKVRWWDEFGETDNKIREAEIPTLDVCWSSQASLKHRYGIEKHLLPKKMFGVYQHRILDENDPLVRDMNDPFATPHSRHTGILREDVLKFPDLKILAESDQAGIGLISGRNGREIYLPSHPEYSRDALKNEWIRDEGRPDVDLPVNYFPNDDPTQRPLLTWRADAAIFVNNWVNSVHEAIIRG